MPSPLDHSFLLWILTAAYAAHILEEYAFDWKTWAEKSLRLPVEWTNFYITNCVVIVLGICASAVGWRLPDFALMFPALAAINAIFFHVGPTVIQRRYSPGAVTAVVLFLPISAWIYSEAAADGILSLRAILISSIGGAVLMLYPIVILRVAARQR